MEVTSMPLFASAAKWITLAYRLVVVLLLAAIVGFIGWVGSRYLLRDWEVRQLKEIITRLEAERRMADVTDVRRVKDIYSKTEWTSFRFVEYDPNGTPLPAKEFKVRGTVAYFDALVIKFEREHVKAGDALRGRSLFLFRRIFGEQQKPADGFPVDGAVESGNVPIPAAYRLSPGRVGDFERDLWADFWRLANDADYQKAMGVRVAHGNAVYTQLDPGKTYRLTIENTGNICLGVQK
jgi:hypothetical protein